MAGKAVAVATADNLHKIIKDVSDANPYPANTPEHEAWKKCTTLISDKMANEL